MMSGSPKKVAFSIGASAASASTCAGGIHDAERLGHVHLDVGADAPGWTDITEPPTRSPVSFACGDDGSLAAPALKREQIWMVQLEPGQPTNEPGMPRNRDGKRSLSRDLLARASFVGDDYVCAEELSV